ncbi:MAG: flagellar biosynthesis protein FlhB [Betaproteobacteria bacterium]|jgi:flagellar biosynthetic protein FlhB|nr:flagellar biosynthesis protein FlhB [Betaproteobacteria bacterium]
MAEESGQDKTEEPTAQRLSKAREEGQIARSQELAPAAMMVMATLFFTMMGQYIFNSMGNLFKSQLQFDRKISDKAELLPAIFGSAIVDGFVIVLPLIAILAVVAALSTTLSGGFIFSPKLALPNFGKLNPMSGLKRMFGTDALIQLGKSIAKFLVVGAILLVSVMNNLNDLTNISQMDLGQAVKVAGTIIVDSCFWLSLGLVLVALVDVPLQRHQLNNKLKMTKQEVKDEMKNSEGNPEVKGQIRRRQREILNNKMMTKVKDADVVITNPTHFAVALSYDPNGDGAPILVAKGDDGLAARIRDEATKHGVYLFEAPLLARALYFTTKLDHPIPEALYHAVAQVIAFVFSLNQSYGRGQEVIKPDPKIPDEMKFDANGALMNS